MLSLKYQLFTTLGCKVKKSNKCDFVKIVQVPRSLLLDNILCLLTRGVLGRVFILHWFPTQETHPLATTGVRYNSVVLTYVLKICSVLYIALRE